MNSVEKNNRLIAKFMGVEFTQVGTREIASPTANEIGSIWADKLQYHSSWSWLMPVLKEARFIWSGYEFDTEEYMHIENEIFPLENTLSELMGNDIQAIYERVVDFVKWWNVKCNGMPCDHSPMPVNNDGKQRCRYCGEVIEE